jgi:hypothetical protein
MGPVAQLVESLIGRSQALPPSLLKRHPELGAVRFRRGGLPPRVGGWALGQRTVAAITLGRTVFLAPGVTLDPALLLHELRHVHQFQSSVAFPIQYLWESVRRGYHRNRFEADARAYAAARLAASDLPRGEG